LNLRRQHFVLGRKLKIGYLSTSLKRHSVGYLARWLIKYHDRQKFELYCYANNQSTSDPVTAWYSQQFTKFFNEPTEDIVTIANQIQQDGIDILVDLDSITYIKGNLLLCLKPAPLQVTWLGWDAAGNNKVDYFIADPFVLPSDAEEYYVENIWRLPNTYIAVDGFEVATPSIHRELLDIPKNAVVFLSAQVSLKRHPDHARLQMEIVKRVPNSYLVLKGDGDQTALEQFFFDMADQVGVSHNRLRFLPRNDGEPEHRANYLIADVILDTYPYTGATHTLEALWMEIPMVTRVGEQFSARNSYTMMINAGITEGIAWTDEEYVEWGVRLGTDAQLRQQVAWKLKQGKHSAPIWNARQFTLEMENAYQKMWATWINSDQSQIVINPADDRDLLLSEAKLLNTEGLNFVQKGEISSAIRCWEYAIFLHPEYVDALYNLGTALSQSRQIEEAIKSFYRVIELQPNNANALYNLGLTLEKCNQLEPAINCYEQAVTIAPEDIDIHIALGGAFFKQRNWSQAINCYETALQINPDSVNALCGLGAVLIEEGRLEVAIDILQSAISINSNNAQVYCNLGHAFTKVGKMEDAAFCYAKALALNPNLANAYWNYNNDVLSDPTNPVFHNYPLRRKLADQFLATCYETDPISALVNYINNYTQSGGSDLILDKFQELEAHVLAHRENLSHMEIEVLYNNFLFTLSSLRDNLVLNTQFFRFVGKLYREKIIKVQLDYPSEPKLEPHPLRVGILSPHFGRHPVGWCSFDVIKALSKLTPHIFLYNTGSLAPDPKTDQFAQVAETFYWYQKDEWKTNNINSYEDRVNWISKDMEKDDLDIILDLDSITIPFNTHLLCRPYLAPVRVSWLGFDAPFVCADNYWLGDRFTHPQGVDDLYVEQIIRLPDAHMAVSGFEVVSIDREAKRQELGISKNQIAYLFAAPARKFNRDCARACLQIIKQVPNSVLMHKGMGDREMILSVYHQECDIQGVDYDRIKYLPAYKTEEEHRAVYQIADVFLDAYPYNGGTHNIEALWSNLPVVTRSGEQSFSRMGNSFIHAAGINTGIGYSWQEYVLSLIHI
jgi:predicted O-linked N-acetylglucosamine transferase (SPINDLY family)